MVEQFDFIVLGGGSAGYAAARTAVELGKRVAIIDGASQLGGLCILRGCMPSKTLIYSAEVLHLAQHAKDFGLDIPHAKINMSELHSRKLRTIKEFSDYCVEQLNSERFTLFRQQAKFIGCNEIELSDGRRLAGDRFMIATGSRVNAPGIPGLDNEKIWTSDDVLELDFLPESVIVLGGGVVACELAQFLLRAGVKVTQIQRSPHILKEASPEAATVVEQAFRDEGMELITHTQLERVEYRDGQFNVRFLHEGQRKERNAAYLFNALGRKPNTAFLDLDAAGVETRNSGHVVTNAHQQTNVPHIYAAGDVAGPHEIVHIAILQGEIAAKHAFRVHADPIDYGHLVSIIFTDPQVAYVGIPEYQLKEDGVDYATADYPFDDHGKSILMEAKYGYVKIHAAKPDGRILAAECVGKDASELIHSMAVGIACEATAEQLLKTHWYHPTLSEIWSYPLEDVCC